MIRKLKKRKSNMRKIVFDLETKKTFDQVGGQRNAAALGISLVGVYDYNDAKYKVFREKDLGEFLKLLRETELLIGFNSKSFDNAVLQPYYQDFDLSKIPHLDILEEIYKSLGHRLKLDSVAQSTLYEGKSGSGLDAIHYYNMGDWASLAKYCLQDVRVTKEVYEYGRNHGYLWYQKAGKPEPIEVDFGGDKKIEQIIFDSWKKHEQIKIEYIDTAGGDAQRKITNIDIHGIKFKKIQGFCHSRKSDIVIEIPKILRAENLGVMSTHQKSLI